MSRDNGKVLTVNFQEIPLQKVIESFAKGFVAPEGKNIVRHESFVDPVKGVVIYKLFVEETPEEKKLLVLPE